MLVAELIRFDPPLSADVSAGSALSVLHDLGMSEWPVVNGASEPIGIAIEALLAMADDSKRVEDVMERETLSVSPDMHLFDAGRKLNLLKRETLPVVNRDGTYVGTLVKSRVMSALTTVLHLDESGSVLTVELEEAHYELSVLVRLIEQEGARILTVSVEAPDAQNPRYRISFKMNLVDVSRVGATLRRHGFMVSTESRTEEQDAEWADRADAFLRYLDI
ncbi:MAG: hypothetical protein RL177_787 [Bacteroidota bacterium]|jgi:CBS domain-containing protein